MLLLCRQLVETCAFTPVSWCLYPANKYKEDSRAGVLAALRGKETGECTGVMLRVLDGFADTRVISKFSR